MWCVAELDEEYIRRMENILAVYEKPLSELEPVVCVDEKPVVLHQEVRPPQTMRPGRGATANTSVAAPPTCFAGCSRKQDGTSPR
jgi:hypothetical protein